MSLSKRAVLAAIAIGATATAPARADVPPPADEDDVPFQVWSAVKTLTQSYADCVDRFDLDGLLAIFAPDAVYDYAPGLMMRGRTEIAAGAKKSLAGVERSSHTVGPPVVRRGDEPGTYVSRVYFFAYHQHTDGGHHTAWGRYLDVFSPDASNRLLISRRKTVSHVTENMTGTRYWLSRTPS
jgi:ketosteroid isomerase-like protein